MKRATQVSLLFPLLIAIPASAAGLPKDPCALLKPEEVQSLAAGAKVSSGKAQPGAPLATSCTWTWGPRTKEWGESSVMVMVMDMTKAYSGHSLDTLKQGMAIKVKQDPKGEQVSVGDAGAFTYEERSHNVTAEALIKSKDSHVIVKFHGDALANKDKVIGLLKTAAGRL